MPKKNTDIRIRRMMAERYMDGEAVEEIAKEAGVTTGTIYRWIRDVRVEQAASEKGERIYSDLWSKRMYGKNGISSCRTRFY